MERYIGLDDHASSCSYAVLDENGELVMEGTVAMELAALRKMLGSLRGRRHVAIENGTRAAWLYHGLYHHCEEILVADLTRLGKYRDPKSDRLDAQQSARLLRLGVLRGIYQRSSREAQALKEAVRCYEQLRQERVRCKNRVKSVFLSVGIRCPGQAVYHPARREESLKRLKAPGKRQRAELLLQAVDTLRELTNTAAKRMQAEAGKRKREYAILQSVTGIGALSAARLMGHIGDPARIRDKRALWRMSGLAVISRSSGDYEVVDRQTGEVLATRRRVQTLGLNRDYSRPLKEIFKIAALTALRNEIIGNEYRRRVQQGKDPALVRVTMARKLSAALLACWQKGERFDIERMRS